MSRFEVVPESSAVLIDARSNVGPIAFGTNAVTGRVTAHVEDGALLAEPRPDAQVVVDLRSLTSGNSIYDGELGQRLDVRRYPLCTIVMTEMTPVGVDDRYLAAGELNLHGLTTSISGSFSMRARPDGGLEVSGEQSFDIRDFDISTPAVLMLRIYPAVRVRIQLALKTTTD
jgi:polyisoprenoid-binding protein YceI